MTIAPANNTSTPPQQSAGKGTSNASRRVVPAIPLALSRPKSAKPKTKGGEDGAGGKKAEVQNGTSPETPKAQQILQPAVNGNGQGHIEAHEVPTSNGVGKTPAASTPRPREGGMDGSTSEPTAVTPARPSTPPTAKDAATASPASSRKQSDRFDMRQIRTELPPAFVPSAEIHTPKSSGSSQSNRPVFHTHGHPTHPSGGSIVFGGQDSSTASPAPPNSAGSAYGPPQVPRFPAQQQPYQGGHSHHASESHDPRMFQPGYQQQQMPWNMRQGYGQPMQTPYFHPHGHMPFRYPPREGFTPAETHQPNGHDSRSRSASQASSGAPHEQQKPAQSIQSPLSPDAPQNSHKPWLHDPRAAFSRHSHPHQPPFHPQMPPPPSFPPHDLNADMENAEALRSHIQSHFSNPALADCYLQITEALDGSQHHFDGHRMILSRSPTLAALIQTHALNSTGTSIQVPVRLEGQYMSINAFTSALKSLYGGQLLQLDHYRQGSSTGEHIPSNSERMDRALQYVAIGSWLKVPPIASRGIDVAIGLLHWDTIASALAFALDGGLSPIWTVDDGSEDRASTSSSDDSLGRPEHTGTPTYDPYSTHLLQRIIDFAVHMFPVNFYLDVSTPQLTACPRLPATPQGHESRPSRSDPRLSQIRFGEIPVGEHQRPSFATSTISSVLLSLPFSLLKCVLEHDDLTTRLGPETVASIMRQVIAEREVRRTKVLGAHGAGQENSSSSLVQNMFWQESVEQSGQHRAGSRLVRRRRDLDTPPSSGACSELNR